MATVRTPRATWIEAGLRALAEGGPESVRVEQLARGLGVTKGSFYWHFADRPALLAELLDTWERVAVDDAIAVVETEHADARGRLRGLFALASSGSDLVRVDLAVRDWARRDTAVSKRLRRVDNRRMAYLRSQFAAFCSDPDDVEARCLVVFSLFTGSHFIAADHAGRRRADVLAVALERLLA